MGTILAVGNGVVDISVRPMNELDFNADTHLLTDLQMSTGGDTMNTAIHLTRLGVDVTLVCRVGEDAFSTIIRDQMATEGIHTRYVKVIPGGKTSVSLVVINDVGERSFYVRRGVNSEVCIDDVDLDRLGEYRIVHSSNYYVLPKLLGEGAAMLFAEAKRQGCITTLDITHDTTGRWMETLRGCLPNVDYFMPSFKEARAVTGAEDPVRMARILMDEGVRNVIIKLGSEGCYFKNSQKEFFVPAHDVQVLDTTGAGDSFVAGYLAGLANGWDDVYSCRFANALAGNCVGHLGATTGRMALPDVVRFMAEVPLKAVPERWQPFSR